MARSFTAPPEFNETAFLVCRSLVRRKNPFFTIGLRFADKTTHGSFLALYAFISLANDITESFPPSSRRAALADLKAQTYKALNDQFSLHPVLHAFQIIVHVYGITPDLIEAFFNAKETDLTKKRYNSAQEYQAYVAGSGESVALMALKIASNCDKFIYRQLSPSVRRLGAAFRKIDFLRYYQRDFERHGRIYFPRFEYDSLTPVSQARICVEIDRDLGTGAAALPELPQEVKRSAYLLCAYYEHILSQMKKVSPDEIKTVSIPISDWQKLKIILRIAIQSSLRQI